MNNNKRQMNKRQTNKRQTNKRQTKRQKQTNKVSKIEQKIKEQKKAVREIANYLKKKVSNKEQYISDTTVRLLRELGVEELKRQILLEITNFKVKPGKNFLSKMGDLINRGLVSYHERLVRKYVTPRFHSFAKKILPSENIVDALVTTCDKRYLYEMAIYPLKPDVKLIETSIKKFRNIDVPLQSSDFDFFGEGGSFEEDFEEDFEEEDEDENSVNSDEDENSVNSDEDENSVNSDEDDEEENSVNSDEDDEEENSVNSDDEEENSESIFDDENFEEDDKPYRGESIFDEEDDMDYRISNSTRSRRKMDSDSEEFGPTKMDCSSETYFRKKINNKILRKKFYKNEDDEDDCEEEDDEIIFINRKNIYAPK